ncbi:MAG: DUF2235 domain-containing protein [Nakamurella sp.]
MKRLVLCCDGTWNKADVGTVTNIEKISRCVETSSDESGAEQIVQYIRGVGTSYRADKLLGGWLGLGLTASILDAYRWLALNYSEGDQIFIFGFSRGAYMARSLGGMITKVGLLRKGGGFGPELLGEARRVYRTTDNAAEAAAFREKHCYPDGPAIEFLGVFDTVGALGLPAPLRWWHPNFHNVELSKQVRHGRHALAIDERRRAFAPSVWQIDASETIDPGQIRQVWFRGAHSDVGGGYQENGLSSITLKWMINEAKGCGLVFNAEQVAAEIAPLTPENLVIHNSMKLIYRVANLFYLPSSKGKFRQGLRLLQLDEGQPASKLYANARVSRWALDEPAPPESLGAESRNVGWFRQQLQRSWQQAVEPDSDPLDGGPAQAAETPVARMGQSAGMVA